jgi:hypothetical protein
MPSMDIFKYHAKGSAGERAILLVKQIPPLLFLTNGREISQEEFTRIVMNQI